MGFRIVLARTSAKWCNIYLGGRKQWAERDVGQLEFCSERKTVRVIAVYEMQISELRRFLFSQQPSDSETSGNLLALWFISFSSPCYLTVYMYVYIPPPTRRYPTNQNLFNPPLGKPLKPNSRKPKQITGRWGGGGVSIKDALKWWLTGEHRCRRFFLSSGRTSDKQSKDI